MLYQILGAALLAAFYGCYYIKLLRQRRRGIRTDQLGAGKTGFVKAVEVLTKIAACLVVAVQLASLALGQTAAPAPVRWLGVVLGAAGVAFFVLSVSALGDNWRAGVPAAGSTSLVTGGVYRISRNPAFLGFDLLHLGLLALFFNGVLLAATLFAVVMLHLQIVNVEEDFLLLAFGEDYLAYRRRVRRYLGRR